MQVSNRELEAQAAARRAAKAAAAAEKLDAAWRAAARKVGRCDCGCKHAVVHATVMHL